MHVIHVSVAEKVTIYINGEEPLLFSPDHALQVKREPHGEFRCLAKNVKDGDEIVQCNPPIMPAPGIMRP